MEINNSDDSVIVRCQNKECEQDLLVAEDAYRIFCQNCSMVFVNPKHYGIFHKLDVLHWFT